MQSKLKMSVLAAAVLAGGMSASGAAVKFGALNRTFYPSPNNGITDVSLSSSAVTFALTGNTTAGSLNLLGFAIDPDENAPTPRQPDYKLTLTWNLTSLAATGSMDIVGYDKDPSMTTPLRSYVSTSLVALDTTRVGSKIIDALFFIPGLDPVLYPDRLVRIYVDGSGYVPNPTGNGPGSGVLADAARVQPSAVPLPLSAASGLALLGAPLLFRRGRGI